MEIKQVQYFLYVADLGSFSSAAEELYISQSSLSKQIIALEKELGVALFDRSKRKIALAPAGETFLKHALNINTEYQALMRDIGEHKKNSTLSIVAIPVIAQYEITSYIAKFREKYPNIQFTLDEREATFILPALKDRLYDLAIIRDNYLDTKRYSITVIANDHLSVIVSKAHKYAARKSISLGELSNENFIMFDKGTIVHEISVDACQKAGFIPRIFYASLRVESIVGLVASNSGIAPIMEKIYAYHKHPDVVAIPLQEIIESNIVIVHPRSKKLSKPARNFMELIKKRDTHLKQVA
jgi:LysR family transcriptional regulator, transcription activator of glutamate synthase operon